MSETTGRLWQLQTELSHLAEREKGLNTKPEDFAELDREFQMVNTKIEQLTRRSEELQKSRRSVESDMQAEQELLKKYQGQLMQVKNQQQYAAAWKEIDTTRKKLKEFEDELLKRMGESEEAEKELQELRAAADPLGEKHKAAYEAWQSSLGELRREAEELRAKIAAIESGLPENIKREFHQVFKQRQGVAMVRVIDSSCGGCRVRIRPQVLQQLKRGELGRCEGCRRFLLP